MKGSGADKLVRHQRVAELWIQGWTQDAIADELGCSPTTVCCAVKAIRSRWQETANEKLDALKADELMRLAAVEQAAWSRFNVTGNPAFLRILLKSSEQRSRLLGLIRDINVNFNSAAFNWDAIVNEPPDPLEQKLLELPDVRRDATEVPAAEANGVHRASQEGA